MVYRIIIKGGNILTDHSSYPILTPEEVVAHIKNGDTVSFSGFTPAGAAKVVPAALASRAREEHAKGRPFKVRVLTGASSGHNTDEDLAKAEAIAWRGPYQSGSAIRKLINRQEVEYVDMHLSHLPQAVAHGFLGRINFATVEASEITPDGRVYLTTSIGASPTYLKYAEKVIIEISQFFPFIRYGYHEWNRRQRGFHPKQLSVDFYSPLCRQRGQTVNHRSDVYSH